MRKSIWGCVTALFLFGGAWHDARAVPAQPPPRENRLRDETSPYLLQHAKNPVDWHPWGSEAFEKARREDKLIFLSIGYSSCHWCHVMEREVFSNEEIARYVNDHFVCIKVDREERPDVDGVYMTALQVYYQAIGVRQAGGWPLSLFLTPDGKPIGGGTYFPAEDTDERVGFLTLCRRVSTAWKESRDDVLQNAEILTRAVQNLERPRLPAAPIRLEAKLIETAARDLLATFDAEYGGFDFHPRLPNRPKFPVPIRLAFLLYLGEHERHQPALDAVRTTLNRMADGGIHDQLGGGFHRYSTDRVWRVPHFEKMLYDNAQLAAVYVEAFRVTGDLRYREVAEDTFAFVLRELSDPTGGFYCALDADLDGEEGTSYVWTRTELVRLLPEAEFAVCEQVYGLDAAPNFGDRYVLERVRSLEEAARVLGRDVKEAARQLEQARGRLLAARSKRPPLHRDDKVLTGWNGLMIASLARGGRVLDRPDLVDAARRAATFLDRRVRDDRGRLLRSWRAGRARHPACLEDYASFVHGLIELHLATNEAAWLDLARKLTDEQIERFWDAERQGFFFTAGDAEPLLVRSKTTLDSVLPSGNSQSIRNLVRLAVLTGEPLEGTSERAAPYLDRARATLEALAPAFQEGPRGMTGYALGLAEFLAPPKLVLETQQKRQAARLPARAVVLAQGEDPPSRDNEESDDEVERHVAGAVYLNVDRLPAGRTCQVLVRIKIDKDWHIHANPAAQDFYIPTEIGLKSKLKVALDSIEYPPPELLPVPGTDEELKIYSGTVDVRGVIAVPKSAGGKKEDLQVLVDYQACNDRLCLKPARLVLKVPVQIAPEGEPVKSINEKLFPKPKPKPKSGAAP